MSSDMSSGPTRFESLLEAVPDALVGMDQEGVIRFVNRQTESLFGYDRDELVGQRIETVVPAPLWQIYVEHQEDYFADPRTRSSGLDLELSGLLKNGTEVPVNISMSHIDTGDVLLVITAVRDVVKQQRAVQDAQLIASVVEYSDDAIVASTLEGAITSWNPAAERMYGYSRQEVIGKPGTCLTPPGREKEFFDNLDSIKDGKPVRGLETVRVGKDGAELPVSITVAPIRSEDGEIVGASAVHRDVTEQRRAFEVAQRMEAVVASSGDAIIGGTLAGLVTSWNPAAERMYGYSSQEIIGQHISRLIPADRSSQVDDVLGRIMTGENAVQLETTYARKDGTVVPVSANISPIRDESGNLVGASAVHRDVTENRQAFEVAQRMEALVESSEDAIIGLTLEGIVTSWNPAAERMYGYSNNEVIGRPIGLMVPEDRSSEVEANLDRIRAGQHVEQHQTVRVRKDGTLLPISLTLSPIHDADGVVVGASGIGRDLTEQELAAHYARSLIEADLDPLVTISPEGTIKDVNEAAVRITGCSREALIGTDYAQYVTEPDKARGYFRQVFEQGVVTNFPLTVRHTGGSLTDVLCNASVYCDISGVVLGVLATGRETGNAVNVLGSPGA